MNIFATITNRTMKQNKARTIVTIIGVILATAMISAVITLGISLQRYMYDYAVETDGNWHVVAKGLSEEQVKEFQENEEVKDSSVISEIGYAKIGENDEDLFGQYLYLQSIDEKAAEMLSVKLTQGRLRKMKMRSLFREDFSKTIMKSESEIRFRSRWETEKMQRETACLSMPIFRLMRKGIQWRLSRSVSRDSLK